MPTKTELPQFCVPQPSGQLSLPQQTCQVQYSTISYGTLLYSTIMYGTLLYCTISYGAIQYCTSMYGTIQCCIISCGTLLYCTSMYGTIQCCITATVHYCTVPACTVQYNVAVSRLRYNTRLYHHELLLCLQQYGVLDRGAPYEILILIPILIHESL